MVDSQGKEAVKSGSWLEGCIADMLSRKGFHELSSQEKAMLVRSDRDLTRYSGRWFVQQVRLERNIYGAVHKSDVFMVDPEHYPEGLHIEAKWQAAAGSVDEKYVFTAMSLAKFRGKAMIVIDGGGTRPCAIQWLKGYARRSGGELEIKTLSEFTAWVQKTF
jgi:hypothetical protein